MRLLIVGSNGFVGSHLLDRLLAQEPWTSSVERVVASSRRKVFLPDGVEPLLWDVVTGPLPEVSFDAVIHAASPASASLNSRHPELYFDQIHSGMKNLIELCKRQRSAPKFLFMSSGAVYGDGNRGSQPWEEDAREAANPLDARNAYASAKRSAEAQLAIAGSAGICLPIAMRLFTFSGRHLPLQRHFAIGNFVYQAANYGKIEVRSTGSAIRSYLDGDDMADWVLSALSLQRRPDKALHVGSEFAVSIADLAGLVAERAAHMTGRDVPIFFKNQASPLDGFNYYVPSTRWTRSFLGVGQRISLPDSIDRMLEGSFNR